ncbi:MAG: transglycosylase SLT domain-containing protein, partial [Candidatus Rokubacteria bacterium]|nr:transglycosylase SLT domain-containing protein [Candidatus Rokubacteria bacterium]
MALVAGMAWGEPVHPRRLDVGIREIAVVYGLEPALIKAVISVESDFDPGAVSAKGARGLMQLMPLTASELGVARIHDPWENIEGGARFLRYQLDRFGGDTTLALAAYNAGEGAVTRYGGVPPFPETQRFVVEVLARYRAFKAAAVPARIAAPPSPPPPATPPSSAEPSIVIAVEDPRDLAEALARFEEGSRREREGRPAAAAALYEEALRLNPALGEARNRRGLLALRAGRLDEARREFEAGLRAEPDNPRLLNNLGLALHLGGDFRAARALFQRAWEQQPSRIESAVNLALAHAQLGQRAEAKAVL